MINKFCVYATFVFLASGVFSSNASHFSLQIENDSGYPLTLSKMIKNYSDFSIKKGEDEICENYELQDHQKTSVFSVKAHTDLFYQEQELEDDISNFHYDGIVLHNESIGDIVLSIKILENTGFSTVFVPEIEQYDNLKVKCSLSKEGSAQTPVLLFKITKISD